MYLLMSEIKKRLIYTQQNIDTQESEDNIDYNEWKITVMK